MAFEKKEKISRSKPKKSVPKMTLQKAIDLGEYDPGFLVTFAEWHTFSHHIQFQYIRKALDNREKQLRVQWAEIVNFLDFRLKPHLKEALKNIERQMKIMERDRERLYMEYSK